MIKMYLRCLALVAALCVGWGANAQVLDEFVYSTGIDSTKWITLTDYTDLSAGGSGDSWRSSVLNIGFNFPFGNDVYTQYSVNSDGNLRLGSTITGTNNYATPFSLSAANTNNPKINFFGCDGYLVSGTHFVHAQTFGDTLLVVEYCLGPYNSTYRNNQFHWQVHLYNTGNIEAVFASASNLNSGNAHYMGMCIDATDGWIINSSGVASHFTNGTTTTNRWANTTWPTPYTYYTFEIPETSCPRPIHITTSDITPTTATITFQSVGSETSWLATITPAIMGNNEFVLTDTVWNLSSLTPNTEYLVSVRAICGVGDTSNAIRTTFHTPCVALTTTDLPYSEDFDSHTTSTTAATGVMPNCWTIGAADVAMNDAQKPQIYYSTSNAHSGNYSLRMYYRGYLAMPLFQNNISDLWLRFWVKQTSAAYKLVVGVMDNPYDSTTFVPIDTINNTTTDMSEYHEVYFNEYTGSGQFIAFHNITTNTYNYSYNYLDDVVVDLAPTCIPPQNIAVRGIANSSATISWTSSATSFIVAYGTDETDMETTITTSNSITLTSLIPNTSYIVKVKAICGPTDESPYSMPMTFTTMCDAVSVPYSINFDNITSYTSFTMPECWTIGAADVAMSSMQKPQIYMGSSHSGPYSLFMYYRSYVALPMFNAAVNNLMLKFWLRQNADTADKLVVGVMDNPYDANTFVSIDTIDNSSTGYEYYEVCFYNYTGNGQYISFHNITTGTASYSYNYIDDVVVDLAPSCIPPQDVAVSNITGRSATISWTGNASNYILVYGSYSSYSWNWTSINTSSTSYSITGLESSTEYTVYVKAVCGDNDESIFTRPTRFTTSCERAIPYSETFENSTYALPDCWTILSTDGFVDHVYCDDCADTAALLLSGSTTNLVLLPAFDMATNLLEMSLWMSPEDVTGYDCGTFTVGYVTDASDASTFVAIETYSYNDFTTLEQRTISFTSAPAYARLALLHCTDSIEGGGWIVGDIDVHLIPNYMSIEPNKWYAIASPTHNSGNDQTLAGVSNLTAGTYDLYGYDEANGAWVKPTTVLEQGRGYIYRHADDTTRLLTFSGESNSGNIEIALSNECADYDLQGFNLIGNPYPYATTLYTPCYTLTPSGTWAAQPYSYDICTGKAVLVHASIYGNAFSFGGFGAKTKSAALAFTVSGNGFEDGAYAMLAKGDGLPKIGHLTAEAPALSIPVNGKRYAIAMIGEEAEGFDLDFRGVSGSYTLTFNPQHLAPGYLHLVDKVACREIDLLHTPTYTFNATGNDTRRFSVKLKPDTVTEGHFARWNGEAWEVEGTGTLQVFDMLGRKLLSRELKNSTTVIRTSMFPSTGVYVLRFGTESQKIVVK